MSFGRRLWNGQSFDFDGRLTPEQAAADLGFATVEELYEFVQANLRGLDKNRDNTICAKPFPPHQNGIPAYVFNAVDNNARAR